MADCAYNTVGPVMFEYTSWILHQAQQQGLKKLYFLARDGYLLQKIAELICHKHNIDIECRYLYCSRFSLRMPSYHLIGDEMYDLLLNNGYYVTAKSLLMRARLTESERNDMYAELGITEPDRKLAYNEFTDICSELRKSERYKKLVLEKSRQAYPVTIEYFRQEKLFDDDAIAIVDSGWTGSMQRSIRQLVRSAGYNGRIVGFYFGMYAKPRETADGEYLTFYFDKDSNTKQKLKFNNNLFECMLSADHPMTLGYEHSDSRITPVFAEEYSADMSRLVQEQIAGALRYVQDNNVYSADYSEQDSRKKTYRLLKRFMVCPTTEEVALYSNFLFCDDVSETYRLSLADGSMQKYLGNYMFITRVFRKLFHTGNHSSQELYWVYGVISCCPKWKRPWYRLNVSLWDWLKIIIKK